MINKNNLKSKIFGFVALVGVVLIPLQANAVSKPFEINELQIVITPDGFPIIWMNAEKYGVDFVYDSTLVASCAEPYAIPVCSVESRDAGAVTYRVYQIKQYVTVTVYYDANGKVVGTSEVDDTPPPPPVPPIAEAEPAASTAVVSNLSGSLAISPNGAANYSMGIDIPPGVAGMQPSIGIGYDSQSGKGSMGIGWGVTGLSQISRCPRTVADDGYPRGIDYTSADAYCLDGSRLVNVNGIYKTKNDNSKEIEAISGGYKVRSKGGMVAEYGLTEDSKIQAQGKSAIAFWLINKVTDNFGNYFTYTYQEDSVNGDYRIERIDYTGNAATAPFASVRFDYNPMYSEDIDVSYTAGSKQSVVKMLKNITTYYGETLVKNYRFIYSYSHNADTRLSKIYECAELYSTSADCKRPIELSWNTESTDVFGKTFNGLITPVYDTDSGAAKDIARIKMADFNGDGRTDLYYFNGGWGATTQDTIHLSNGDGTYLPPRNGINSSVIASNDYWVQLDSNRIMFGDFNGDGMSDAYYVRGRRDDSNNADMQDYIYFAPPDGSGAYSTANSAPAMSFSVGFDLDAANYDLARLKMGDFNGDGRTDIYYVRGRNSTTTDSVYLSNGDGTFAEVPGLTTWVDDNHAAMDIARINTGDFNGDGLTDLYRINGWGTSEPSIDTVYISNGNGTFTPKTTNISSYITANDRDSSTDVARMKFADFNGDGLTDVYRVNAKNSSYADDSLWISRGDGQFNHYTVQGFQTYVGSAGANANLDISRIVPGDFNGDGKSDIYYINGWGEKSDPTDFIYTYKTDGNFEKKIDGLDTYIHNSASAAAIGVSRLKFGDFNGDGANDIYLVNGWGTQYSTQDNIYPTLINSKLVVEEIKDGFENITTLKYQYLSEAGQTVYEKYNTDASLTVQNFQGPMRVVSGKITTNGFDGFTETSYKYAGARVSLEGRGQLGFAKTISNNKQTKLVTEVNYNQTYPYIGMVNNELQTLNGNKLSYTLNTPASFPLGNGREIPYLSLKTIDSHDIDGTQVSTVTSKNEINGNVNGDITDVLVTTVDKTATGLGASYTTTTHNNYTHSGSTDINLQSLIGSSTVSKSGPIGTSPTVTQNYVYDEITYKLKSEFGSVNDGVEHAGIIKTYTYDNFGHINSTTITSASNDIEPRTVTTSYDVIGRFAETVTNEMGHTGSSTYDPVFGVTLTSTGANGLVTSYQYNNWGELTDTYAPGGNTSHTETQWCQINCELPAINPNVEPQVAKFTVTGSVAGGPALDKYAPDVTTYYDKLGRSIRQQTTNFKNETVLVDTAYDDLGRVVALTQPYFPGDLKHETTNEYDILNRVTKSSTPGEGYTSAQFIDAEFKIITTRHSISTPAETSVSSEKKNVIGQVLYNTDNDGNVLHYEYDAQGNQIKTLMPSVDANGVINNPKGTVVSIAYDVFGRKISMNDPNMGYWTYQYDSTSKLRSQTDASGQITSMVYDRLGRLVERTDADGRKSFWVFNDDLIAGNTPNTMAIGKLDAVYQQDASGFEEYRQTLSYTPDLGLAGISTTIIEEGDVIASNKVSYITQTTYDQFHRPEVVSYPETTPATATSPAKKLQLKQVYTNGVLTDVKNADESISYWQARDVDAQGQILQAKYGVTSVKTDGIVSQVKDYDVAGRLTLMDYADGVNSTLYNSSYEYNDLGSLIYRKSIRANAIEFLTERYYYDSLQRLSSVEINGIANAKQFTYDVLGNIRSKTGLGSYEYNGTQPHAVSRVNGADYLYNNNGGLQSGGGRLVSWSVFNKPLTISNSGAYSTFSYAPSRARYKQKSVELATATEAQKELTTIYVGSGYEKITENGITKHKHYIAVGGNTIAQYTVEQTSPLDTGTDKLEYLLRDNQGSTVAVVDDTGLVTAQMDYDAFGNRRPILGETAITSIVNKIPRGYTGHEHLEKLGLIHMNGRVYDPVLGRFLSADPFIQFSKNIQSYNRYSYVLNNPMSYTDPSGFLSLKKLVRGVAKVITLGAYAVYIAQAYAKPVRSVFMKYSWARVALQIAASVYGQAYGAAIASAYLTDISGGSFGDVVKAAAISYVSARAFSKIGADYTNASFAAASVKILAHGAVGCVSASASGGSCRKGATLSIVAQSLKYGMDSMSGANSTLETATGEPTIKPDPNASFYKRMVEEGTADVSDITAPNVGAGLTSKVEEIVGMRVSNAIEYLKNNGMITNINEASQHISGMSGVGRWLGENSPILSFTAKYMPGFHAGAITHDNIFGKITRQLGIDGTSWGTAVNGVTAVPFIALQYVAFGAGNIKYTNELIMNR